MAAMVVKTFILFYAVSQSDIEADGHVLPYTQVYGQVPTLFDVYIWIRLAYEID